ncbi:xanthine dehydrogenase accessory protein XdhC [Colwellia psychrerythraea]|uniref:Xanthine dehydrogenase accessory protein XdhC n=1 Tax=Colwellia psychrerythraea TaxID=28229 RepID=A0A099KKE7_COLPS|nr:xanthine dehydrogenase accessory protein XdhC [Colwellia psychrerythraea]KGJ90901.1 xanthine dehydrogenase accessory protein XdhC [Colwellia psychrerythraea]
MKMNWTGAVHQLNKQGKAYVVATIVGVTGSTPRNSGTKMVITNEDIFDTIGGGHLEHKVIKHAHQLLTGGEACQQLEHFQLGAQLGQCCGGDASVLFECFSASGANIILFGAGHVGKALIPILAGLPCSITWVDNRVEQFPDDIDSYSNVTAVVSENPAEEVATMPTNSYYIVMTHNHQLDFDISHNILKRADFSYSGLIASDTKWRRFQQRFQHRDIEKSLVEQMNCPIGLAQVQGKLPMEVAVSVAGEIIQLYQKQLAANSVANPDANRQKDAKEKSSKKGIAWQELKSLVNPKISKEVSEKV